LIISKATDLATLDGWVDGPRSGLVGCVISHRFANHMVDAGQPQNRCSRRGYDPIVGSEPVDLPGDAGRVARLTPQSHVMFTVAVRGHTAKLLRQQAAEGTAILPRERMRQLRLSD
jgi:hypothetical protein